MSIKKWCLKRSLRKAFKKRYYQDLSVYENSLKGCMSDFYKCDDWSLDAVNSYITAAFSDMRKHWKIPCEFSDVGAMATWLYKALMLKLYQAQHAGKAKIGTFKFSAPDILLTSVIFYNLFEDWAQANEEPFSELNVSNVMCKWQRLNEETAEIVAEEAPDAATMETIGRIKAALSRDDGA